MSDSEQILKFLNQEVNTLQPSEQKEFILNTNYAGRKVYISIKIDAINSQSKQSSTIES